MAHLNNVVLTKWAESNEVVLAWVAGSLMWTGCSLNIMSQPWQVLFEPDVAQTPDSWSIYDLWLVLGNQNHPVSRLPIKTRRIYMWDMESLNQRCTHSRCIMLKYLWSSSFVMVWIENEKCKSWCVDEPSHISESQREKVTDGKKLKRRNLFSPLSQEPPSPLLAN